MADADLRSLRRFALAWRILYVVTVVVGVAGCTELGIVMLQAWERLG